MTDRDWPRVGNKVAMFYRTGIYGSTVRIDKVKRLTATQIVMEGGRKFRRTDLREIASCDVGWDHRGKLLRLDDPNVKKAESIRIYDVARHGIETLFRPQGRSADSYNAAERQDNLRRIITIAQRALNDLDTIEMTI